MQPSLSPTTP